MVLAAVVVCSAPVGLEVGSLAFRRTSPGSQMSLGAMAGGFGTFFPTLEGVPRWCGVGLLFLGDDMRRLTKFVFFPLTGSLWRLVPSPPLRL